MLMKWTPCMGEGRSNPLNQWLILTTFYQQRSLKQKKDTDDLTVFFAFEIWGRCYKEIYS